MVSGGAVAGPLADALPEASLGIAPENDLLVFSGMSEPPTLVVARFVDGVWTEDTRLPPKGVFAGSPTSTDFGARRVLVRLRDSRPEIQEYEDDGTAWRPVGKPQPVDGMFAPSLTPSGLTMVWIQRDADGNNNVVAANRDSTSDWFGDPVVILHAFSARAPQLLDGKRCDQLYVIVDNQLRRYQR